MAKSQAQKIEELEKRIKELEASVPAKPKPKPMKERVEELEAKVDELLERPPVIEREIIKEVPYYYPPVRIYPYYEYPKPLITWQYEPYKYTWTSSTISGTGDYKVYTTGNTDQSWSSGNLPPAIN